MAVSKKKTRSVLGDNPLSQGIFSKTEVGKLPQLDPTKNKESIVKNKESRFLKKLEREAVNLRLPIELNDWLNELLKKGKRRHGSKIPKEIWVQASLELFQALPVNWEEIDSEESLREMLKSLESSFKNLKESQQPTDKSRVSKRAER